MPHEVSSPVLATIKTNQRRQIRQGNNSPRGLDRSRSRELFSSPSRGQNPLKFCFINPADNHSIEDILVKFRNSRWLENGTPACLKRPLTPHHKGAVNNSLQEHNKMEVNPSDNGHKNMTFNEHSKPKTGKKSPIQKEKTNEARHQETKKQQIALLRNQNRHHFKGQTNSLNANNPKMSLLEERISVLLQEIQTKDKIIHNLRSELSAFKLQLARGSNHANNRFKKQHTQPTELLDHQTDRVKKTVGSNGMMGAQEAFLRMKTTMGHQNNLMAGASHEEIYISSFQDQEITNFSPSTAEMPASSLQRLKRVIQDNKFNDFEKENFRLKSQFGECLNKLLKAEHQIAIFKQQHEKVLGQFQKLQSEHDFFRRSGDMKDLYKSESAREQYLLREIQCLRESIQLSKQQKQQFLETCLKQERDSNDRIKQTCRKLLIELEFSNRKKDIELEQLRSQKDYQLNSLKQKFFKLTQMVRESHNMNHGRSNLGVKPSRHHLDSLEVSPD